MGEKSNSRQILPFPIFIPIDIFLKTHAGVGLLADGNRAGVGQGRVDQLPGAGGRLKGVHQLPGGGDRDAHEDRHDRDDHEDLGERYTELFLFVFDHESTPILF